MFSRRRLITRGLKLEDIKCDLPKANEELICDDCGVVMQLTYQFIGKRAFCKACAPWYKARAEEDAKLVEQDLNRSTEEIEAELDFGERDYWD